MLKLTVKGLSCGHCVQTVTNAISKVQGATNVAVNLGTGHVTVEGPAAALAVREAIERAGYSVAGGE